MIKALDHILKDYNDLVYDISESRKKPYIQVSAINPDHTEHNISVGGHVCRELEQMTRDVYTSMLMCVRMCENITELVKIN